ncbi:MAG: LuxR C-terminal-related transcriptional regulator [Acidimicrobiales bacterium]
MTSLSGSGPSGADPFDDMLEVVRRSPLPALVMELPSKRIVATNSAAREVLPAPGSELVGRAIESFTADAPYASLDELLISGRLKGFETDRLLRLSDGSSVPVQAWVRVLGEEDPPRHALVVFTLNGPSVGGDRSPLPEDLNVVIGTTDVGLRIDRVSSDIGSLLGFEPGGLIGRALVEIVDGSDFAGVMWALAQSITTGKGVALYVHVKHATGETSLCLMLLVPIDPLPGFAFALMSTDLSGATLTGGDVETLLWRTRRGIDAVNSSRDIARLAQTRVHQLSELSSRELEVVTKLLGGYRVPATARALFVSQSTVRNHLSSIFKKLHVHSQQELIDLLTAEKDTTSNDK